MKPRPLARSKVLSQAEVVDACRRARKRGESIVWTNGCFDLLHTGHLRSLEEAARLGDRLVVGVNSDASVRRAKGAGRPIQSARERMEILAGLAVVDWVVGFGSDTPLRLIERIEPDVLAKGGDWKSDAIVGGDFVRARGGKVVRLGVVPGRRTTRLIERVRAGRAGRPQTKR